MSFVSQNRGLIFAAVLLAVAVTIVVCTMGGRSGGVLTGAAFQEELSEHVARAMSDFCSPPKRISIVAFVEDPHGVYARRERRLTALLKEAGHEVSVFNPFIQGVAIDDHYTPALEQAIAAHSPQVVVVSSPGSFTHVQMTAPLRRFFDAGGRAVFVGNADHAASPALELIRRGSAIALARRAALAAAAPSTGHSVSDHYTILTADNIAALIPAPLR